MTEMLMNLGYLMRHYTPGDGHTWDDEFQWITTHHTDKFAGLQANVQITGHIREPILLGDDGRVWDGHHRILAAHQLGLKEVPVEYAKEGNDD